METTTKWILDPSHSEINFKVRHLMISTVKGEFRKKQGEVIAKGTDFSNASVNLSIDPSSIYTNDEGRDNHLMGADFFDVENHKEITITGSSFTKVDDENYKFKGLLTMKGIAKEVDFKVEFGGINKDPWGNEKAGFSVTGNINRKDWGLTWNAALETGGVLVSDEIKLAAEVQLVKQPR